MMATPAVARPVASDARGAKTVVSTPTLASAAGKKDEAKQADGRKLSPGLRIAIFAVAAALVLALAGVAMWSLLGNSTLTARQKTFMIAHANDFTAASNKAQAGMIEQLSNSPDSPSGPSAAPDEDGPLFELDPQTIDALPDDVKSEIPEETLEEYGGSPPADPPGGGLLGGLPGASGDPLTDVGAGVDESVAEHLGTMQDELATMRKFSNRIGSNATTEADDIVATAKALYAQTEKAATAVAAGSVDDAQRSDLREAIAAYNAAVAAFNDISA